MLEFNDSDAAAKVAERARALMDEVVIPRERGLRGGATVSEGTISDLREAAREYGAYAPRIGEEWGGVG